MMVVIGGLSLFAFFLLAYAVWLHRQYQRLRDDYRKLSQQYRQMTMVMRQVQRIAEKKTTRQN